SDKAVSELNAAKSELEEQLKARVEDIQKLTDQNHLLNKDLNKIIGVLKKEFPEEIEAMLKTEGLAEVIISVWEYVCRLAQGHYERTLELENVNQLAQERSQIILELERTNQRKTLKIEQQKKELRRLNYQILKAEDSKEYLKTGIKRILISKNQSSRIISHLRTSIIGLDQKLNRKKCSSPNQSLNISNLFSPASFESPIKDSSSGQIFSVNQISSSRQLFSPDRSSSSSQILSPGCKGSL
ncbi:MAG: hypothetical protein ACOVOR_03940, partial [Rhabdochlamydiaceae bacterium]